MKKKILFVIPSLGSGGAERSLITLLSLFDYNKYQVTLLSFRREGLFFDSIPDTVEIVKGTENYEMFDGDAKKAVKFFLKKLKLKSAFERCKYYRENDENKKWKLLKNQLPKIKETFDCAIGYLEGNASKLVIENINARKKIIYVHNDFKELGLDKKINRSLFEKADKVVTVSERCLNSLYNEFPDLREKFCVIENITSSIVLKNQKGIKFPYDINNEDKTILLTVGRFYPQKAIDLAVLACNELVKRSQNIVWYHIGSGGEEKKICSLIKQLNLENIFILLGEKANPYPYIGFCDIYVQPSKYEGKSIAIDEAKCLFKPIVVTDFSTVFDQIQDGVNGIICHMNEIDMADKIEMLLNNPRMRNELSENLKSEKTGNEEEINKIYKLIEN